MITSTSLQEEIQQQISIGFTKQEIGQNLLAKGYIEIEIKEALAKINFSKVAAESNGGSVSTKSILLGVLFLVVVFIRLARYANGGNIFLGISVITGIGMVIYFFTKRT